MSQYIIDLHSREVKEGTISLMTIFDKPPRYRSYLLAFWEERGLDSQGLAVWRFSLEDPRTGQRRGFASLEALVAVLKHEITGKQMDKTERRVGGPS